MFRGTQDTFLPHNLFVYGTITLYGYIFQCILLRLIKIIKVLQPCNCKNNYSLGFFQFARRYYGNHYCFLFLRLLRCFSSPGMLKILWIGLPHSEILVLQIVCIYTRLIAAYHVFHRS